MPKSVIKTGQAIRFLLSYMKKYRRSIACGIFLLMTVDTFQLLIPRIIKRILDTLGQQNFSTTLILQNALMIAGLALAMTVLRFFYRLLLFLPSRKIETKMRDDLFTHLTRLSFSFFNVTKTGDLMALLINDMNAVRMATGMALIGMTDCIFLGALSLAFMIGISAKLTLITIAPLPVIVIFMIKFGNLIQTKYKNVQESFSDISSLAQESFSGIRVVKGFLQEHGELSVFSKRCDEYIDKNLQLTKIWGALFPMIGFAGSFSICLLTLFGGRQVLSGQISLGGFIAFSFYVQLFVWPIMAFGFVFNILQRGLASSKRLMELKAQESDIRAPRSIPIGYPPIKGGILIKDLSFRFPGSGKDILQHINLKIPAGGALGIIGRPGSGKTALVSLLFHLFPIEAGRVLIDGSDINDVPLPHLRKSIGYVPQDSFLFSDTIENNIAFGLEKQAADRASIRRAAEIAAIDKDISLFPQAYATVIGERGITLSGGQKQRLSIARAIVLNPAILILDDALSSVDAATEKDILSHIKMEIKGRTTIIIAHRISTVRACDSIIVLENGIITEQGAHDELISKGAFYAKLSELQKPGE
jgi:ATP-binding cassette, subfamily B, multidrug efflux pump